MLRLFLVILICCLPVSAQRPEEVASWTGLPQEPVAKKERSDLEDDGIKGRVRFIEYSTVQHRPGKPDSQKRLIRIEEYNDRGNRVATKYVRDGVIASAIFYGYIDGERASKSAGSADGSGTGAVDPRPRDSRFEFKHRYKYQDGRLSEEVLISNYNELWLTYRRNYTPQTVEMLVYTKDGKLNQKYIHGFDEKGNEIGFETFNVFKNPNEVGFRARYSYGAFDAADNWTERTQSYRTSKDGRESYEPYETTFRTITYFK